MRWQRGSPFRSAGVLHILGWLLFIVLETMLTPLLLPLIGYTYYRDQKKPRNQMKSQDKDQTTKSPDKTTEDGGGAKEQSGRSSEGKDRSRDIFGMRTLPFDQQGFAEAKAYKKPGKIYYFSTFRGHRDSIIKRLVK